MSQPLCVLADIGGTNTRVALSDGTVVRTDSTRRYRNAEHSGIIDVLRHYLSEVGVSPSAAGVAMAGPVRDNVGTLTNLDWRVDHHDIGQALEIETVTVLNDLQAQGHAIPHLPDTAFSQIATGARARVGATRLVVGVGTGLNAAVIQPTVTETIVPPSEAGHITLPLRTDEDLRLLHFVERRHAAPGIEDVLSGRGLERLYQWRCEEDGVTDAEPLAAADIMTRCAEDPNGRAGMAVHKAVQLFGRYAGDLCLIHLPFGGLYLCGGVARAFAPYLDRFGFVGSFRDKGRFSSFMQQFPVAIVDDDYAALTGTASHLGELMSNPS